MQVGYKNWRISYEIEGRQLNRETKEMIFDFKWDKQRSKVVVAANPILGMIQRSLCYLNREMVSKLNFSLIRPRSEYSIQTWRSYLKKDIILLEGFKEGQLGRQSNLKIKPLQIDFRVKINCFRN